MASIINATDVVTYIGDTVVGCAQSMDVTVARTIDPATCSSSGGWAQGSPGERSWSGSIGAIARVFPTAEEAANISYKDMLSTLVDGTEVDFEFTLGGEQGERYGGKAYLSNLALSKPETGTVTWTADFTGNGPYGLITA
ncbi:phage tail protein [Hymenobacter aerilatus]|uniref:Phage tail protein n=1 Tax=Hymenobacter aerilatus TaxID=2932251 RepID=A0A8T9SY43_9BACT|nr:phage tail tube protein [Hymenobacter aerilatus]UOR07162.1 phage tail protein [Hymenobacter aerilatus]